MTDKEKLDEIATALGYRVSGWAKEPEELHQSIIKNISQLRKNNEIYTELKSCVQFIKAL